MSSPIRTFLLLGASGDLAGRLLLPALGKLLEAEPDRRGLVLVGAGAEDWDAETWRERVVSSFTAGGVSSATLDAVLADTRWPR
jgi:glucose-6-phosphate 1-dehydrogenase